MSDLASYAAREEYSRGRIYRENNPSYRNQYQRDRDRIIHCAAFRRLEYKTQVFVSHEGDMFRTRLTHSIEVAQIGRTIARALKLSEDLTEAICLAHDLGHTPFGHAGQDILNICMHDRGGFEHNLQSLRVVDVLEERYPDFPGLNLMYETREGILKHCSRTNAAGLGELGRRFLEGGQPGLEAQIANLADEIAYNNHDVDDGLRAGLITTDQLKECELFYTQYKKVNIQWPGLNERRRIHELVRRMINSLVSDVITTSQQQINASHPPDINAVRNAPAPMITMSEEMRAMHMELKHFLKINLYRHERVLKMTQEAGHIMQTLFNLYFSDSRLLPLDVQGRSKEAEDKAGISGHARIVADYIAGMTDRFAHAEYKRLANLHAQAENS
jgi:dGTPase